MGIALAMEAARLGANVSLILGPTVVPTPRKRKNLRIVRVVGAVEMERKVREHLPGTRVFVGAAAVSDYRPATLFRQKIKEKPVNVQLKLVRNPDIIARVACRGPRRPSVVIGFALETQDMLENAADKLRRKGLDWVVANRETNLGAPEGSAILISRWGERIPIGRMSKERLAKQIWKALLDRPAL
jgi:phosphopantothenoylcysteine decarboxylase/phosphopantothenate--cysteine ligase